MGDGARDALGNAVSSDVADADITGIAGAALRDLPAPRFIKDAVREELAQALRAEVSEYVPGARSLRTHLRIVARYRAIDLCRVESRRRAHAESIEALAAAKPDLVERFHSRDEYAEVEFWDAVDRALNAEQAKLLALLLTGAKHTDIARDLGMDKRRFSERVKKLRVVLAMALFGVVDL